MLRRSFFPAGVLLAALTALRPAAAAEAPAAPKLTADDYIEIQQLYASYAHALDKAKASASLPRLFSTASSPAEEGRAAAARRETRSRAKMRSWQWAVAAA